ncbi:hypothetical protein CFP56_024136, partial [Quercus suber]
LCNNAPETIIPALRDCPKAQLFWSSFSLPFQSPPFFFYGSHLVDWLKLNCKSSRTCDSSNIALGTIFPIALWTLWAYGYIETILSLEERPTRRI